MAESSRVLFVVLLLGVAACGVWGIHVFGGTNGLFDMVNEIADGTASRLPGTKHALLRVYSGFKPLDDFLTILTIVFQSSVDGLSPSTSLFTLEFYGQAVALTTIFMIEGQRAGNKGKLVSFTGVVGMIYQTISVGLTVPTYWAVSLLTSPSGYNSSAATLTLDRQAVSTLPLSIVIGFTVPSILMSLPAAIVGGTENHQKFIGLWQFFPFYVSFIHFALTRTVGTIFPPEDSTPRNHYKSLLKRLRVVYAFAIFSATSAHIASFTLAMSVDFFPMLFRPNAVSSISTTNVFLPPLPWSGYKAKTIGDGFLTLLQYDMYTMSLGSLIWAVAIYRNAQLRHGCWEGWILILLKTIITSVLLGPMAAVVILVWERDETVLGYDMDLQVKKSL